MFALIQNAHSKFHRRHCKYGGEDEYYIQVREKGNQTQEKIRSEVQEENTKDQPLCISLKIKTYSIMFSYWMKLSLPADSQSTSFHLAKLPSNCLDSIPATVERYTAFQEDGEPELGAVDTGKIDRDCKRVKALDSSQVASTCEAI